MRENSARIPYKNSWNRIARAEAHRRAFDEIWGSVNKSELHTTALTIEQGGVGILRCIPGKASIPSELPLLLGEMIYQLRMALDNAVYDAADIKCSHCPLPDAEAIGFPICSNSKQFRQAVSRLSLLSDRQRTFVESLQPYNVPQVSPEGAVVSPHRTLSILNTLAEIERHRSIKIISSWVATTTPVITLPLGIQLKGINVRPYGTVEGADIVATLRLKGFTGNMEVAIKAELQLNPTVDECPLPCHPTDVLSTRMDMMLLVVKDIVRAISTD
jgi:hypothetical protein